MLFPRNFLQVKVISLYHFHYYAKYKSCNNSAVLVLQNDLISRNIFQKSRDFCTKKNSVKVIYSSSGKFQIPETEMSHSLHTLTSFCVETLNCIPESRCSLEKAWEFFFSLKYFVKLIYTTIMDTRIVWIMLPRSVQDECRKEWVMHPKRFVPERRLRISAALSVFSGLLCKVIKMLLLSGRPWCMALTAFTLSLNKTIIHPRLSQIMHEHDLKHRFG